MLASPLTADLRPYGGNTVHFVGRAFWFPVPGFGRLRPGARRGSAAAANNGWPDCKLNIITLGAVFHGITAARLRRVDRLKAVRTGLAMRPIWGPMYGPKAVSEQGLLEETIDRLPDGSMVIGDANSGVFSVAWTATRHGHPVL
jgi:hypothetical protein